MTAISRWGYLSFGLLVITMFLDGCSPTPQITAVEPVIELATMNTYELKNCGVTTEMRESYALHFEIKPEIIIADAAVSIASGAAYPLTATTKDELAAQIKEAYRQKFDAAQTELELKELVVPGDKVRTFSLRWYNHVYKTTLSYDIQGKPYTIEYQYILTIPEVTGSTSADCGG